VICKVIAIAAGLISATVIPSEALAQGNAFWSQATTALEAISRRVLEARRDNLQVINSLDNDNEVDGVHCLNEISNQLVDLESHLDTVSMLVNIRNLMETAGDQAEVSRYLTAEIDNSLNSLPLHRRALNLNPEFCGSSAAIADRAQTARSLFDEGQHLLSGLKQRNWMPW